MSIRLKIIALFILVILGSALLVGRFYLHQQQLESLAQSKFSEVAEKCADDKALTFGGDNQCSQISVLADNAKLELDVLSGKKQHFLIIFAASFFAILCVFFILIFRGIMRPLREVARVSNALAVGYLENTIKLSGDREIDELLHALEAIQAARIELNEHMERQISETEASYCNLEESSAALNAANARLSSLNASINIMLNALNQGLFLFGSDGVCSSVYSKACLSLLGDAPSGRAVAEVLAVPNEDADSIGRVLRLVFADSQMSLDVYDLLALLPDSFMRGDGTRISMEYHPVMDEAQKVSAILAVATDHSAEDAARQLMRDREDEALSVLRISGNRNMFTGFYHSITEFLTGLDGPISSLDSLEVLRRDLHTFKGTAATFHLQDLVDWLHDMEDHISDIQDVIQARHEIRSDMPRVQAILTKMHKRAYDLLGRDFDRHGVIRTLPLSVLGAMAERLKEVPGSAALHKDFVETLMGEPIRKALAAFDINLRELADRYGKKVSPCYFTGDNFLLLTEKYQPLFASLSHIARNIISHAIDPQENRSELGKDPELTVVIETKKYQVNGQDWFSIVFEDDGCGINVDALRQKAVDKIGEAAARMSDAEIINRIFDDNTSTSSGVSELSGRGVGLSAVRAVAERLGGRVSAESELGVYTKIIIEAPIDWSLSSKEYNTA